MQSTRLVPVMLPNRALVKIEARVSGERDIGASERFSEPLSLDIMRDAIEGVAQLVDKALDKIKPHKVVVEFGVELSYEAGKLTSLIVEGSSKGSLKIAIEWTPGSATPKI